jgi:gamma-glutamyltranspeptidase / glutathione hydrolase
MTGLGGDAFCLFYDSERRRVRALNGSGSSPARATLEVVRRGIGSRNAIPRASPHAVTVPGSAAAWVDVVERFGSGKLSLEQVLSPAVEMAESGIPIGEVTSSEVRIPPSGIQTRCRENANHDEINSGNSTKPLCCPCQTAAIC